MKWNIEKLGNHCDITSSKRIFCADYKTSGVPFFRSKEIIQRHFHQEIDEPLYITKEKYDSIKKQFGVPQTGDMLLTSVGTIGIPYIIKERDYFYFKDGNLTWFRDFKSTLSSSFLYYWIQSHDGKGTLNSLTIGSSQKALTIASLKNLKFPLPHIKKQEKIVEILSAYDNLIENNQRQIKLLEEAAMRLYREWFVHLRFPGHENAQVAEGVPSGWKRVSLKKSIEFNPRITLPKEGRRKNVPMAALSVSSMNIDLSMIGIVTSNAGSKFQNGDTLLARITPCLENGKTAYVNFLQENEIAIGSTEFLVMRSKGINPYMVYCFARTDEFRKIAIQSMSGSDGRQRVKVDKLEESIYLQPPQSLIDLYEIQMKPIFQAVNKLNEACFDLILARDKLLPKLMNGEIEV